MPLMKGRTVPPGGPGSNAAIAGRVECRPFLWNPQEPNQLIMPSIFTASSQEPSSSTSGLAVGELQYGVALADGGTDCNDFELLALTQILEAHASYHSSNREPSDRAPTPHRGREGAETRFHRIQGLSQQYVDSIRHCVEGWEGAITQRRVEAASENGMVVEGVVDEEDLEILLNLKYMFGLVTMSNAYLRLVSPLSPLRRRGGMNPWHYPGLVSAGVVRFFRETYPVLKDRQPQEVLFGDGAPMTVDVVDWSLIRSFVLRGLLEPAWLCLQRDPIYITAKQEISHGGTNKDRALMRAYQSIVDDTESVGVLLLLAPLPGGRAVHPLDDGQVEQMIEELVEYDSVSSLRPSDSMGWDATGDGYSHQEAYRKHHLWQGEVRDYVQVRKTLEHKRAEFDELLSIMGGNIRDVRFESWAEELCATILYKAPSMTPRQLSDCAAQIAGNSKYWKYDDKSDEAPLQTTDLVPRVVVEGLLSLMSGLVEVGIPLLWKLGGSSGAALPSAIATLMYTLYIGAGVGETLIAEKAELLTRTSAAVLSSVGTLQSTQLSIQLLMPYALEDGSSELVETIAATLELHTPADYSIASRVIDLCRPLLDGHALDVLDGCSCLLLACYRDSCYSGYYGDAVFCLGKGVELEAQVLPGEVLSEGLCYRKLAGDCNRAVQELADDFLSRDGFLNAGEASAVVELAEAMITGLDCDTHGNLASFIPSVRVLRSVAASCLGGISLRERADHLVACLRPEGRSDGKVRFSAASPSLSRQLLQMTNKILLEVEHVSNQAATDPTPAFDVDGVAVLMQKLGEVRSLERAKPSCARSCSESEMTEMERGLGLALKRAYAGSKLGTKAGESQGESTDLKDQGPMDQGYFSFLLISNDKKIATVGSMLDT